MNRLRIAAIALAVLFILAVARLARLDAGGPAHSFVMLPGNIPATLYLPGPGEPFFNQFPKPVAERPPAVVLVHGFMADRQFMSVLARRLTENGYAVLAIDVHGHGENRNPLEGGEMVETASLRDDVKQAVEFLRGYDQVDGSRIVVMGHSMGAGAVLSYVTRDPSLKASVMISGGWILGPERPKNALFIFAERDPVDAIQDTSTALVAHLAGVTNVELGKRYGDFGDGSAVEAVRVPRADHISICYSADAATTIVRWLDSALAITRTGKIDMSEPRLDASLIAQLLFVILLVPIGRAAGLLAPHSTEGAISPGGWLGIAIVGGALMAAMPLVAIAAPASFLSIVVGDAQVSWFGVAGVIIVGGLALANRIEWTRIREGLGRTMFAAALAFAVAYVCQIPIFAIVHRLTFTPERLVVFVLASLLLLPFWFGFEFLIRRGTTTMSTIQALVGRIVILVLLVVGVSLHILSFVLILIMPILALNFVMLEIFAASAYSASRNVALIAIFESLWFAWLMAAANPILFMF